MSRGGEVSLWFGDEERTFRLGLKQLRRLQEKCADRILGERGPFTILRDLQMGTWRADDVVQTIQLGLTGGGMTEEDAAKLVKDRFEDHVGLFQHVLTASAILHAAIIGPADDEIQTPNGGAPPGEAKGAETGSASPRSTETEPSSAGLPGKSMN